MVRADLLDAVDDSLRRYRDPWKPFGGVQLLIIGDLGQLAPVVKDSEKEHLARIYEPPYFFSSRALCQAGYITVELKTIYRQNDANFVKLLNQVRSGLVDANLISALNQRYIAGFNPSDNQGYIRLTTHNARARDINDSRMQLLKTPSYTYQAVVNGDFPETSYPAEYDLQLKVGAQVMFIRNDVQKRFFNGMIGIVTGCGDTCVEVVPIGRDEVIRVEAVSWMNTRFVVDEKTATVKEELIGSFEQIPLRAAWAITIHKSQGLTFDRAIIDANYSFAHGQVYVALSRCRSLEGLVLDSPLTISAFISDAKVKAYTDEQRCLLVDETKVNTLAETYYLSMLERIFDFTEFRRMFNSLHRLVDEYLAKAYPRLAEQYVKYDNVLSDDIESIAAKFVVRVRQIAESSNTPERQTLMDERIASASKYFAEKFAPIVKLIQSTPVEADNKAASKRIASLVDDIYEWMFIECQMLKFFTSEKFSAKAMLDVRAKAILQLESSSSKLKRTPRNRRKTNIPEDVTDAGLYLELCTWRSSLSSKLGIAAYQVLANKSLIAIANDKPLTKYELLSISGIGRDKASKYGAEIVKIVETYLNNPDG